MPAEKLAIIGNCLTCPFKDHRLFCHIPDDLLQKLQKIKVTSVYPKGRLLYLQGQDPRGVFILCTGKVKLSTASSEGNSIILRFAEPGEILGLTAALSGAPYEATAETVERTQANFIPRKEFLHFSENDPSLELRIARQLSHDCKCAYDEIRSIGLSTSVSARVARLLLHWSENPLHLSNTRENEIPIRVTLTQEEIAQFTATTRETVTRVLGHFKDKHWLEIKGVTWVILNKSALTHLVKA